MASSSPPHPSPSPSLSPSHQLQEKERVLSCFLILITFCIFASMVVIVGFYSSHDLTIGPNTSRLLQANSFFVQDIMVKAGGDGSSNHKGAALYGFFNPPPFDKTMTAWSESHNTSIPPNSYKVWTYYFNSGAQAEITYGVKSHMGSDPLILIVSRGKENLVEWIENPLNPNITLSWSLIQGNGVIKQKIVKTSDYYIAMGNSNNQEIGVQLNFGIQTLLYNTMDAYYKCSLDQGQCVFKLFFLKTNFGLLTTSGPRQDNK